MGAGTRRRAVATAATAAAVVLGSMATGAGASSAATPGQAAQPLAAQPELVVHPDTGIYFDFFYGGIDRGTLEWSQDPDPDHNCPYGDAFRVEDIYHDGWGIEAQMVGTSRIATTSGHDAPYWSPWNTGDLKENTDHEIIVYLEQGGSSIYLGTVTVES